jgi:hypothetical protein
MEQRSRSASEPDRAPAVTAPRRSAPALESARAVQAAPTQRSLVVASLLRCPDDDDDEARAG